MGILFSQSDHTYCRIPARTLNTTADKASREIKNLSSKWILNKPIFQKLIQTICLHPDCTTRSQST